MLKLEQFCTNVTSNIVQPRSYFFLFLINLQQFIKNNNDNRNKNNNKKHADLQNIHFPTLSTKTEGEHSV